MISSQIKTAKKDWAQVGPNFPFEFSPYLPLIIHGVTK